MQNFGTNDHIDFAAASTGLTNFAQVQAAEFYDAAINTTIITGAGGTDVWLVNQTPAQLTASQFGFI